MLVQFLHFSTIRWWDGTLTVISIIPALIFVLIGLQYWSPDEWANTSGDFFCPAYNDTTNALITHDDDWVVAPDQCKVPILLGSLLPGVLWYD